LDGGVAFVTGAASGQPPFSLFCRHFNISPPNSGIGAATAAKFASLGASALVLCDINLAAQTAQAEKLGLQYPNVEILPLQIDTRDEDSIVRAHQMAVKRFGRIDYAVNNAGIPGVMKATPEMTVDEFGLAMNTNLTGVWICQREQITQMLKQEPLR
jgi:NAD(P)-dependent dehydrogenase (short-subunit alcohol dehydrogenase family)